MRNSDTGHTRRRVLSGGAAGLATAGLAGCGLFGDGDPELPPAPDPLQPLADEALALAAAYDRAAAADPALATRFTPLAADHREHAAELAAVIGRTAAASASAAAPTGDGTLAGFRAAEKTAMTNAVSACKATTTERAGLVGSIAACRATHIEALR
ncbi:hypothetical protein [Paractinoplanes durhamensis]|uniref:hypothetical protein n=1 Tax=Paractinoplanes durhamensis TaxID=113563 RepID=UPI001EF1DA7D|nr:hypothetical protein [Actinoplanes durhamensis]